MVKSDFIRLSAVVFGIVVAAVIIVPLFKRNRLGPTPVNLTVNVCRGEHEAQCPRHGFFIGCGSIRQFAQTRCQNFAIVNSSEAPGGQCGYVIANVICHVSH